MKIHNSNNGFTLVELIMVMIVVSIVAVYAVPKLLVSSDIATTVYQNRVISILRNIQTRAMQDTRNNGVCYQVNFDNANDQLGVPSTNYSSEDVTTLTTQTCASTIDTSDTRELFHIPTSALQSDQIDLIAIGNNGTEIASIDFDSMGRANKDGAECDGNLGCRVRFIGDSTATVCIESEGLIYACNK